MEEQNRQFRDLVEKLGDRATLEESWRDLDQAGIAALPAVREGLSHPNWRVRQWSAGFLDAHWDQATLQRLILTLHDPKLKVRKAAVHSLGCDRCKGGQNPIDVLPHLAERIRADTSIKVRRTAVMTLASQTPSRQIARVLRRVLRDETDLKVRRWAEFGLRRYAQVSAPTRSRAGDET